MIKGYPLWDECYSQSAETMTRNYYDQDAQLILTHLLATEQQTLITEDYFLHFQQSITSNMRAVVVEWMREVCAEMSLETIVFPLSVRIMDQFLSVCEISRSNLQLLGAVCMYLSSKLHQTPALTARTLVMYTDSSISTADLFQMELLLLIKLNWNINFVTPSVVVDYILRRVSWTNERLILRGVTHVLLQLCSTDHELIVARPSTVAIGCLIAAARHLNIPSAPYVLDELCLLTQVSREDAEDVVRRAHVFLIRHFPQPTVIHTLEKHFLSVMGEDSDSDESDSGVAPRTPKDVHNVRF